MAHDSMGQLGRFSGLGWAHSYDCGQLDVEQTALMILPWLFLMFGCQLAVD